MGYDIVIFCEFLAGFQKIKTHLRTHDNCHMLIFESSVTINGSAALSFYSYSCICKTDSSSQHVYPYEYVLDAIHTSLINWHIFFTL